MFVSLFYRRSEVWSYPFPTNDLCTSMCVALHVLLFLGTFVMLCDFHRMQAWNRFLVKTENGIPKDVAIKIKQSHLIPMSRSISPDDFEKKRKALQESPE